MSKIIILGAMAWPCYIENYAIERFIMRLNCVDTLLSDLSPILLDLISIMCCCLKGFKSRGGSAYKIKPKLSCVLEQDI